MMGSSSSRSVSQVDRSFGGKEKGGEVELVTIPMLIFVLMWTDDVSFARGR